jgi:hypothetical protein
MIQPMLDGLAELGEGEHRGLILNTYLHKIPQQKKA